ncbi:MAG: hypothetical protein S4CHLAM2_01530 [Chlamydiales bacterium]|nr:hypothetical protein [Chlamydiales bacterium]
MWKKVLLVCLSYSYLIQGRELLPPFPDSLSVNPAIPDAFVMGPDPDLYSGIIWGEKEAIDRLIESRKVDSIFFFVRLSGDIIQQGPDCFADEFNLPDRFTSMGCTDVEIQKTYWNQHPVLITHYLDHQKREEFRAWIGLNSRIGGWVLSVSFQYPESQSAPTQEQLTVWKTFLQSTAIP